MKDIQHPLQFEITLKRLAMTALIGHIYEHPDIKEKTKEIIRTKYQGSPHPFPLKPIKKEIIKIASKKINTLELPKNLKSEAQGISVFFAKNTASWAENIVRVLKIRMSYFDKIYWTNLGTLDDGKIFESYWETHKSFSEVLMGVEKDGLTTPIFTALMACKFGKEELILASQNMIIDDAQRRLGRVKLPNIKNKVEQLLAVYTYYIYGPAYDEQHGAEIYKKFEETGEIKIKEVIFLCTGNAKEVKLLWRSLSSEDKNSIIIKLAEDTLGGAFCGANVHFSLNDNEFGKDTEIEDAGQSAMSEAILFLINEMSPEQRYQFLKKNACEVMEIFLLSWPYQELCLKMLEEKWIRAIVSEGGEELLYTLLCRMRKDLTDVAFVKGSCHYPKVFHEILKIVFGLVSKKVKETILFNKSYYLNKGLEFPNAIETFYYIFDLVALSIIINDKDLKKKRDSIIDMGSWKISDLIKKGNLKSVVSFMEKVLISNGERKKFISKWNLKRVALNAGSTDIQQKILGWLKA